MSQPRKIEFTGGFTIVPNNGGIPPGGTSGYYLWQVYSPAINNGEITIPLHTTNTGQAGLDFNVIDGTTGDAIYIKQYDSNGNNNYTYLSNLIGNHTHLTFSQGTYHITFDCTNQAWNYGAIHLQNQFYHDPTFEGAPVNSMSIISTSGQAFNTVDPITITVQVI